MVIDKEQSAVLKSKYNFQQGHCYDNAIKLFQKHEVDNYIIGYIYFPKTNFYVRHAWGTKDKKVIDATLDELKDDHEYYPLFIFESSLELVKNLRIHRRASMFEFNLAQEEQFILPRVEIPLEENNPIIFRRYWNRYVQNELLAFDSQSGKIFIANNACTVLNEYKQM